MLKLYLDINQKFILIIEAISISIIKVIASSV